MILKSLNLIKKIKLVSLCLFCFMGLVCCSNFAVAMSSDGSDQGEGVTQAKSFEQNGSSDSEEYENYPEKIEKIFSSVGSYLGSNAAGKIEKGAHVLLKEKGMEKSSCNLYIFNGDFYGKDKPATSVYLDYEIFQYEDLPNEVDRGVYLKLLLPKDGTTVFDGLDKVFVEFKRVSDGTVVFGQDVSFVDLMDSGVYERTKQLYSSFELEEYEVDAIMNGIIKKWKEEYSKVLELRADANNFFNFETKQGNGEQYEVNFYKNGEYGSKPEKIAASEKNWVFNAKN